MNVFFVVCYLSWGIKIFVWFYILMIYKLFMKRGIEFGWKMKFVLSCLRGGSGLIIDYWGIVVGRLNMYINIFRCNWYLVKLGVNYR